MSKIRFYFENIEEPDVPKDVIFKQIEFLIKNEGKTPGELSIILCDDNYLLTINKRFLDHDYFTDIVTFDYGEGSVISGDLFISLERVSDNAKLYHRPVLEELCRVIFHGVLHLTGYSDHSDEAKRLMRKKENFYLEGMPTGEEKE